MSLYVPLSKGTHDAITAAMERWFDDFLDRIEEKVTHVSPDGGRT
jgi:hypothetical protein